MISTNNSTFRLQTTICDNSNYLYSSLPFVNFLFLKAIGGSRRGFRGLEPPLLWTINTFKWIRLVGTSPPLFSWISPPHPPLKWLDPPLEIFLHRLYLEYVSQFLKFGSKSYVSYQDFLQIMKRGSLLTGWCNAKELFFSCMDMYGINSLLTVIHYLCYHNLTLFIFIVN